MKRTLWIIVLAALSTNGWAQDSGPGPNSGQTQRVYSVSFVQFFSALQGRLAFTKGEGAGVTGSGGVTTGNSLSNSGTTTTSPFSGNTAPQPTGGNGGTGSPSVAAFVVNPNLGASNGGGNNSNNSGNFNSQANSQANSMAANGSFSKGAIANNGAGNSGFGASGALMTSGTLIATLDDQIAEGAWQAFDLGGYAIWFAQANGDLSLQAWGWATPDSLVGWASVQSPLLSPSLFGSQFNSQLPSLLPSQFGSFFPQTYLVFGQAADEDLAFPDR